MVSYNNLTVLRQYIAFFFYQECRGRLISRRTRIGLVQISTGIVRTPTTLDLSQEKNRGNFFLTLPFFPQSDQSGCQRRLDQYFTPSRRQSKSLLGNLPRSTVSEGILIGKLLLCASSVGKERNLPATWSPKLDRAFRCWSPRLSVRNMTQL